MLYVYHIYMYSIYLLISSSYLNEKEIDRFDYECQENPDLFCYILETSSCHKQHPISSRLFCIK